jgi:uncharacterized protein
VSKKSQWYSEGIRFECQGSGRCCLSREEYGHVYMTLEDRRRMARHLGLSTAQFTRAYCEKNAGYFQLKQSHPKACRFLVDKKCSIYEGRPSQCRTWPFWPEVLSPKKWSTEVQAFCPGVGKGRLYSSAEIEAIAEEARQASELL